jgi:nucleoside-diphosphate-sugar epimerase
MEKVLITGISGFIGAHLASRLKQDGYDVIGLDLKGDNVLECDITNRERVSEVLKEVKPSFVVHLAAFTNAARDEALIDRALKINFEGTKNLIDAFEGKKFVNISTGEVYFGNKVPFNEKMEVNPASPYSAGKRKAEEYLEKSGKNFLTLRLSLVYGEGQDDGKFMPQIVMSAVKGREIELTGCKQKRDYIYIEDVVEAIVKALETDVDGEIINIGSGKQYELEKVKELVEKTAGRKVKIKKRLEYRDNELWEYVLDNKKAKELLGWEPRVSIEEGIRRVVENVRV